MKRMSRSGALVPILIVIVLAFFAQRIISPPASGDEKNYTDFIAQINGAPQDVESVKIKTNDNTIDVIETDGSEYSTGYLDNTEEQLTNTLERQDIETTVEGKGGSSLLSLLTYILPFILIFGFWMFLMNQMQGGGSRVMNFGKSKAKRMSVLGDRPAAVSVDGEQAGMLPPGARVTITAADR
ncbi:MAG: ATP-dependent metallopeptidase FtsH/Yme1/Tma family protein, partial [Solirubrobacterales bacterium]